LGEEWTSWTGLPFVYAAWIGRISSLPPGTVSMLQEAARRGLSSLDLIIQESNLLPAEETKSYLTHNVSYLLGEDEIKGLKKFHGFLKELGLAKNEFRINYYAQ
jgi:chorismate dehydratase